MKTTISLNGTWKIFPADKKIGNFYKFNFNDKHWLSIEVPSHWQEHKELKNYGGRVYYRRTFSIPRHFLNNYTIRLQFKGIFYHAKIWLNEFYIGEHEGYFAPFEYDITDIVKQHNIITLEVYCPFEKNINAKKMITGVFSHWDCVPAWINPGGIWNSVNLIISEKQYIKRCFIDTEINEDGSAIINYTTDCCAKSNKKLDLITEIEGLNFKSSKIRTCNRIILKKGDNTLIQTVKLTKPMLWHTWDVGTPNLYKTTVMLADNDKIIDEKCIKFGIRTVAFDNWRFSLNNRRIFIRGTNYVPAIRISKIDKTFFEKDLKMMIDANMNMLRIHGHINREELYEVADELGILIWQDFPLQWLYSKNIKKEACKQIKEMVLHLYNHPSIVVWNCHNEPFYVPPQLTYEQGRLLTTQLAFMLAIFVAHILPNWNKNVLDRKLAKIIASIDKSRTIVPHSGIFCSFFGGTDAHLYFGWYFQKFKSLKIWYPLIKPELRFVTEFGAQSFPDLKNFEKFDAGNNIENLDWAKLTDEYCLQKFLMDIFVPKSQKTLAEYISDSQKYQAQLTKFYIEFLRKLKYKPCGGILQFMFVDAYPAISWAIVDFWRTKKLAYDICKMCFNPVHIFSDFPKDYYTTGRNYSLKIYVVNDLHKYLDATAHWCVKDEKSSHPVVRGEKRIKLEPDSVQFVQKIRWSPVRRGSYKLCLKLKYDGKEIVNLYDLQVAR